MYTSTRTVALGIFASILALLPTAAATAQKPVAATPPMGWNSWDSHGLTITEDQFRANVKVLHDKLLPFGWRYAVIDEGWFFENPADRDTPAKLHYALDSHGRYVPVPARFPSAGTQGPATADTTGTLAATIEETSFAALGRWVHAQGLLFGIHIVRGIPRASVERNLPVEASAFHATDVADTTDACSWDPTNWGVRDNAAGQAWYDSLLRQYSAWGIDILKVDCISDHPYKADEIRMIRRAIDKIVARTGRPIVLSLSPGPTSPTHAAEVATLANMWRISNDVWDVWAPTSTNEDGFPQGIRGQFALAARWTHFNLATGRWPDLDMLPLGELRPVPGWGKPRSTRLTPDEQRTLLTLWSIAQSPLILGANLTLLDDATLKLLTNPDVLRIDQHAVKRGAPLDLPDAPTDLRVWTATVRAADGKAKPVAALFNLGDKPLAIDRPLTDLGLASGPATIFDVWTGHDLDRSSQISTTLPPHSCMLLERR
jgi:hypothetical protein